MTTNKNRRNSWIAIGIIALPFVWTIPTFYYLHQQTQSRNTQCESQLKKLGISILSEYAANHDGVLPDAKNWLNKIKDFKINDLRCPNDPDKSRKVSYAMNANLSGKKLSEIKNPSQVILLYETNSKESTPFGVGKDMADIGKPKNGQGRHNLVGYRFNFFLMADGTVRQAGTPDEKKSLRWTP